MAYTWGHSRVFLWALFRHSNYLERAGLDGCDHDGWCPPLPIVILMVTFANEQLSEGHTSLEASLNAGLPALSARSS